MMPISQLPYLTFTADGTGKFTNPNLTDEEARRGSGFQWRLDGYKVTVISAGDAATNEFQFTNQTRISIPFQPKFDRGLFIVYTREGTKSK